jgi:hypothetical protein
VVNWLWFVLGVLVGSFVAGIGIYLAIKRAFKNMW